ncbi:MAG: type III pantothenate kinase, partial [Lachnospiraceae bacterium]
MILAIDMGNSNIVIGGIDEQHSYFMERITTDTRKTDLEYAISIKNILELWHVTPP